MKILIVEDNEDSRNLLSKQLRSYGHEVITANNGIEALEQALKDAPDIVVSDIQMPEMDGFQLCRQWKQNEKLKYIPVVFYTATYTSQEDEKFALNLGVNAFVRKPTDPGVLAKILSEIIEQAGAGLLPPPIVESLGQDEYLEEYNKRLVAKLQKKIEDLNLEISRRKKAESDIRRIGRMLRTISECNQLLVHATDEKELLESICDLVVRSEGFPLAWAGFAENDEDKTVRPVAFAGSVTEYLNNLKISWADNEFGKGPTGVAIRTGKHCIARYGTTDSDFARWHASAAKYGFNSSIALPLISEGITIGSLNIYSKDEDAFNEEQVKLLAELADDLAYGITALRKRHELDIATENLVRSEKKYSTLVEYSSDGIIIIQDGLIKFANRETTRMTGFTLNETIGKALADFVSPRYKEFVSERYTRRMAGEDVPSRYEVEINRKNGKAVPVEINAGIIEYDGKPADMALIRDITERKEAEQQVLRQRTILEAINRVFEDTLECETDEEVARSCLSVAEQLTGSEFGWIGEINKAGLLDTLAQSDPGWQACRIPGTTATKCIRNMDVRGVWGRVLKSRKALITNDPSTHPDSVGVPDGHPSLTSFLGVPLKDGAKTFGMIALANKPDGYTLLEQEAVEKLSVAMVELLRRKRADNSVRLHERHLQELVELYKMTEDRRKSISDYVSYTLESVQKSLQSRIAFIGTMNEDESIFTTLAWTKDTMKQCAIEKKPMRFSIAESGLWGEVVRQRRPIVINDYDAAEEYKKGYPEGHIPIKRFLSVPIFSSDRIVAVAAVANRDSEYNDSDVNVLTSLLHEMWNLTERKKDEEALKESEAKYRLLVENIPVGVAIMRGGKILFTNSQNEQISGYTIEELKSINPFDAIYEEDRAKVTEYAAMRVRGESVPGSYDIRIIHKDGSLRWLNRNVVRIDWLGEKALLIIDTDITERIKAEQAVQESEKKYHSLFTQSTEGIYVHDLDGNIVDVNEVACIQTEYTREELLQLNVFDLHPDCQPTANNPKPEIIELWKGWQTGQRFYYEGEHRRKNGNVYPTEISTGVIEYGNNKYILAIVKDITERKEAAESLRKERESARRILDTAQAIILTLDSKGKIVHFNPYTTAISGYTIDEVRGKDWFETFLPQRNRQQTRAMFNKALETVKPASNVDIIVTKAGEERFIDWYFISIKDNGGETLGVLSTGQDVTERRKAEEEVLASETRYRRLFEAAKDGILIVNAETGLIFDVNPFLINLLGLTKEDFIGKELWEIGIFKDIVANKANFEELRQKGRIRYEDLPLRTHDGRQVDVEFVSNVYEVDHSKVIQCNIRDITERKKAEEALKDEATRRRILLEQSRDGIVVLNQEGGVHEANKRFAEMLGYSNEEVLKLHAWDWEYMASQDRLVEMLRDVDEKGDQFETKHRRKDGSIYDVEISTNGAIFAGQKLIFCVCRDITERKNAQEELRESQHLFSTVANTSPALVWMSGTDKLCNWFNEPWLTFTGRTMEQEMGNGWTDGVHPDDLAGCLKTYVQAFDSRQEFSMEYRLRHHDGEYRWIIDKGTPRFDANGNFMGYIGSCLDITERKKAAEQMRKSEEKYRTLFETMRQGVIFWNENGKLISANAATEGILGLSMEQMLGKSPAEIFRKAIHENGSAFPKNKYPSCMALKSGNSAKDIIMGVFNFKEDRYRWIVINAMPLFKENENKPHQVYTTYSDITQIKQIERALIQSENNLRQLLDSWTTTFNSINNGICLLSLDGTVIRCNQAMNDILGKTDKEINGEKCFRLVHGTERRIKGCPHLKMIKSGHREAFEYMVGEKWFYTVVDPIFDGKGNISASVHIMEDITERKKTAERMIVTDRLASIGELSSGIAHELNNPLTSVIGLTQLLLEGGNIPEDISRDLQLVNSEARRAAKVVKNLLVFARRHPNEMQLSDVNQAVEKVLELREYEQKVSNIRVIRKLDPHLPRILMDYFQIQQVFLNIVVNAEFAMVEAHNKGTLIIKSERAGEMVRVSFTDDGPGISGENLKKLFDPFFTTKEVGKGTGLGLSICHGIISQHRGNIYAESELGKGATFAVELPINLSEETEGENNE